jgi:hypothetical protein
MKRIFLLLIYPTLSPFIPVKPGLPSLEKFEKIKSFHFRRIVLKRPNGNPASKRRWLLIIIKGHQLFVVVSVDLKFHQSLFSRKFSTQVGIHFITFAGKENY